MDLSNFSTNPRSADRVERISELLQQLWGRHPQLRLGQLLVNIDPRFEHNAFFLEDDELEAALRKVLAKGFGGE